MSLLEFESTIKQLEFKLQESERTADTYKRRTDQLVNEMEITKEQHQNIKFKEHDLL